LNFKQMQNKSVHFYFVIFILGLLVAVPTLFFVKSYISEGISSNTALPAFPGAEGFGSVTQGGRFGKVILVTNLNDTKDVSSPNYPGSLRWAVEHTWPTEINNPFNNRRIIIFKTGGTIDLVDKLIVRHPFVTMAGQTAPGDGILLRGDQLTIATHDVIVRGIRVRVGDEGLPTCCRDGINISTTEAESDVYNIIVDHSSVSWAIDENVSLWTSEKKPFKTHDVTIQWNIISEGLQNSIHVDEGAVVTDPHSMGMIVGQNGYNVSIHHNLFANNSGRNPRISGIVNSEIINNVIYGWKDRAVEISSDKNVVHIQNNYFIPSTDSRKTEISFSKNMNWGSQFYIDGNITLDTQAQKTNIHARIDNPDELKLASALIFKPSSVTISPGDIAYNWVLSYAGAITPTRDNVDLRIVNNVINGTGKIIDSQEQVGGWPDLDQGRYPEDTDNDGIPDNWEQTHGLNMYLATDANNPSFLAPSGYTWLEEYINSLLPISSEKSSSNQFFDFLKFIVKKLIAPTICPGC